MRYLCLIGLVILGSFPRVLADEVSQKTDGSFVGEDPTSTSGSFVGDDSKSIDNDDFIGDNIQKETDTPFVGANSTNAPNTYFSGQTYEQQVQGSTVPAFAQDNSQTTSSDGVFSGEDTSKRTDGSFVGSDYGK